MAAIDKMHEFYTCARRFAFLAKRDLYRPMPDEIEFPADIHASLDLICSYFNENPEFLKLAEEAEEWFDEAHKRIEMMRRKEFIAEIVKECCQ